MYTVPSCPVCSSTSFIHFGHAKDFTVSHETFSLVKCANCEFLITSPRPDDHNLPAYYQSDEYVSHTAKATTSFDKLYEIAREFALKWKLTQVKKSFSQGLNTPSLLDYGCGTGFFLKTMKKNGFNIAGVEPSAKAKTAAEENTGIEIHDQLENASGNFDVITLWHVLEHVSNINEVIDQLKSKLNPNGTLLIAVPNHKSNDAEKYKMNWAGYDVPRHLWHFEQTTMTKLMQKHNLKIVQTIPMKLDAFYVSMLSEKYLAGKQSLTTFLKGAINGFLSNIKAKQNNYSSIIYIVRHA